MLHYVLDSLSECKLERVVVVVGSTGDQVEKKLRDLSATIYAYDQVAAFIARKSVSAPALMDDSKRFPLSGFGFTFRLMEMNE